MTTPGSSESSYHQFGPKGRAFMCASCLVCAACLAWLFANLRSEIEPSKILEHPDTIRLHLTYQGTTPAEHQRQAKIISDYSRMRRWYPVLVQMSLLVSLIGSACAIIGAIRFAFPEGVSHPQAVQAAAKGDDKPKTGV